VLGVLAHTLVTGVHDVEVDERIAEFDVLVLIFQWSTAFRELPVLGDEFSLFSGELLFSTAAASRIKLIARVILLFPSFLVAMLIFIF
jgi:hypothetical protein